MTAGRNDRARPRLELGAGEAPILGSAPSGIGNVVARTIGLVAACTTSAAIGADSRGTLSVSATVTESCVVSYSQSREPPKVSCTPATRWSYTPEPDEEPPAPPREGLKQVDGSERRRADGDDRRFVTITY